MPSSVEEVRSSGGMKDFIRLPHRLYRGDPCYVPPLQVSVRELFDRKRHPFHEHADVAFFLDGVTVEEAMGSLSASANDVGLGDLLPGQLPVHNGLQAARGHQG